MIREVTLEDIQPGAEFYSVFCIAGRPSFDLRHVVCDSGPIQWSDAFTEKDCVKISFMNGDELRSDIRSLVDLHIIRHGRQLKASYNLHRLFHTKDDAYNYIGSIMLGTMENPLDQNFLNETDLARSIR